MSTKDHTYPNQLKKAIKQSGYTLGEIAAETHIPTRTLTDYCAGRIPIPKNRLEVLSDTLGYSPESLVPKMRQEEGDVEVRSQLFLDTVVFPTTIQAYEEVLALAWTAFYTSGAQLASRAVETWLLQLAMQIHLTRGEEQDCLLALRCRFLQLSSVIARDRSDFVKALNEGNEALTIAYRLQNAELMASALFRHAKVLFEQHHYDKAIQYLENALPYAARSRDPLRCYVSMFLAEVYSYMGSVDKEFFQKALHLLDGVDRTLRTKKILEDDGSFTKVDIPGLYMVRGDVLRRSESFEEARGALQMVQKSLPKELIRWQGNFSFSEAQLFLKSNEIENSCEKASHAFTIFQSTNSRTGMAKVYQIFQDLQKLQLQHPRVKALATQMKDMVSEAQEEKVL